MKPLPTLRQMRFLAAVVSRRHFGLAAEDCLVSQSTLSAGIAELESQLGVLLLERTKRSVNPTAIGLSVAEQARKVLEAAEGLVELAAEARDPLSGPLRLGMIPTLGPFVTPLIMPTLREAFPKLKIYLREDLSARLMDQLESGALDAALIAKPYDLGRRESVDLRRDRFFVVFPPGHRFAGLASIGFRELAHEDLLLLEEGHCLRDQALKACDLEGARRNVAYQGTSLHTLVQMVRGGLGLTLLPELAIRAGILNGLELGAAPLDSEAPYRTVALAWRGSSARRETLLNLAGRVAESLADA
jgi:LysR family transcriptional regulator, hydrogen peroxide-inducible genes activator